MKKTISAILLVATLLTTVIASCFVAGEKALVANAASESYYTLEVSAPETANAGDVIDVVMTAKNIKTELDAIEFFLDFDETKLAGVITESGESMDKFMTVVPQYIMEYNGVEIGPAPRYEQICRYNTETGVYECR
ncbi:MAG: hypothetical protein J6V36_00955, partial [Clostridia bacterium]|nr:hypothetical protein [Clostridia bacterium]